MKQIDVLAKLKALGVPAFRTHDVVAYLKITVTHASHSLSRLAAAGHVVRLAQGRWGFAEKIQPFDLPGILTDPFPSYISLQSALYHYGMISQIPSTVYAISLARTRLFKSPLGNVSVHHVQPAFFFGYDNLGNSSTLIASPEKALLDICYLTPAKTGLFRSLPELELPKDFDVEKARAMIERVPFVRRRSLVRTRFESLVSKLSES